MADPYHKECVDTDPPWEPRAHELKERLVRSFALDKQKTTESVQTEYNLEDGGWGSSNVSGG